MRRTSYIHLLFCFCLACNSLWEPWLVSRDKTGGSTDELSTLSLVAGGLGGPGNVDGSGAAARFDYPVGIAADDAGNLYVVDSNNQTIRKVVTSTGAVTTLAGAAGIFGRDDGTSAAARFGYPIGMAADRAGNLYVGDAFNQTIRKIVIGTGAVTTLAGTAAMSGSADGTGAAARFNDPDGIVADGAGNLYVTDSNNQTIRKIVISTGAVTTLAGTAGLSGSTDGTGAAARFKAPVGVVADGAGNIYTTDLTIRKIVTSTGAVTTLAGTVSMSGSVDGTGAAARFDYPIGIAADRTGNLYVADQQNWTIRRIVMSTGAVTTLAGTAGMAGTADGTGAAARFYGPTGVVADGSGNLYTTDYSTIRKIVISTGAVTTLAGMAGTTGSADGIGTAARFNNPSGVATDDAGNLYVVDASNYTIRKVVTSSGAVSTIAGMAGMSGNVDGVGTAARFSLPEGLAADGAGNLYVADTINQAIRKVVVSTGEVTTIAGGLLATGHFLAPHGIASDGADNLYVSDTDNRIIRKIALSTATVTTIIGVPGQRSVKLGALPAGLNQPVGVAVSPEGGLFIVDNSENAVLWAH